MEVLSTLAGAALAASESLNRRIRTPSFHTWLTFNDISWHPRSWSYLLSHEYAFQHHLPRDLCRRRDDQLVEILGPVYWRCIGSLGSAAHPRPHGMHRIPHWRMVLDTDDESTWQLHFPAPHMVEVFPRAKKKRGKIGTAISPLGR